MEDSPNPNLTLLQAIAGKWQMPLFILSMVAFVAVLFQLRPRSEHPTFEQELEALKALSQENRYDEFYARAEKVRQLSETDEELGQVHLLAAQTRVRELRQRHELGLNATQKSAAANYNNIINDFRQAFRRNIIDPNSSESSPIYEDLALSYWGLDNTDKALYFLNRAIGVSDGFKPYLYRTLVQMYMAARPKGYQEKCLGLVDKLLESKEASADDKSWAYIRKAELMIATGREEEALTMLNTVKADLEKSAYSDELLLMRGRALRKEGKDDEADMLLRDLLSHLSDRGDVYAQVVLELGHINYEQFRDQDAQHFYRLVVDTQIDKDWYVAGLLGLAECAALQQRYQESLGLYEDAVERLRRKPHNQAVDCREVQQSLLLLAHQLNILKQYDKALAFLEIEQKIAPQDDVISAEQLAWTYRRLAGQLMEQLGRSQRMVSEKEPTETEKKWQEQQRGFIKDYFDKAAEQFLRVASLATNNDQLYGDSIWQAATCYDKAGNVEKAIKTWLRFVQERDGHPRWPQALFYLAQAHQSIGEYDAAIEYYELLLKKHPNAPAAFECIVPLARCYLKKETPDVAKAKKLLLSVFDNPAQNPPSRYFRQALFELGELHYENKEYDLAIKRLSEGIDRYPDDVSLGKYMFLVGDSYRLTGLAMDQLIRQLANDPSATVNREQKIAQRRNYLGNARDYFTKAITFYKSIPQGRRSELDKIYLRHSWMYRADCEFYMGNYAQAVSLYEEVALRYQLTETSLQALMQIVNCQVKLGNMKEAGAANRRAIWQLDKIPESTLAAAPASRTRQEWRQWFNWMENSGLW